MGRYDAAVEDRLAGRGDRSAQLAAEAEALSTLAAVKSSMDELIRTAFEGREPIGSSILVASVPGNQPAGDRAASQPTPAPAIHPMQPPRRKTEV